MDSSTRVVVEDDLITSVICPDGNNCLNGGTCIKVDRKYTYPSVDGEKDRQYRCNCAPEITDGFSLFAGYQCEYKGVNTCIYGSFASRSFCTNGDCIERFEPSNEKEAIHKGCICDDGFTGEYCEYIIGTEPIVKKNTTSPSISIFIFFASSFLIGSLFYVGYRRKAKTIVIKTAESEIV